MVLFNLVGAVVMALLAILPALAFRKEIRALALWVKSWTPPGLIPGRAGVVVVTYTWPNTGTGGPSTTAPSAAQASEVPVQTAQVFFADTDTQAVFTHNWGLQASFPTALYPLVIITKSLGGGSDSSFQTNFTIGKTLTNSITINKISIGTGSGGTYDVALIRGSGPWLK